jgi:hypothetical protein
MDRNDSKMSDDLDMLDFAKDMPLTEDDIRALDESRRRRIDPSQMKWEWISLGRQFPNINRERPTSEGWIEFEL